MFDFQDIVGKFAQQYVEQLNRDTEFGDWEAASWTKRDAKRIIREMNMVLKAVDVLTNVGLTIK